MRLIIGISGSSGVIYGIRLLETLRAMPEVETHLVISQGAKLNIALETSWKPREVEALADRVYNDADLAAPISSGSFRTGGMIIAPCSIKTLSGVVNCYADNLVARAADVVLKEGRRLVLVPARVAPACGPYPVAARGGDHGRHHLPAHARLLQWAQDH